MRAIAVVEPHMDDATLSVGGRILLLRGKARITIVSATRRSNYAQGTMHRDAARITATRLAESARAAEILGARHLSVEENDAPLRFRPESDWPARGLERKLKRFAAFGPDDLNSLVKKLREAIEPLAPEEIWIPLGVGPNLDHWRTRDACLSLGLDARLFAYEDVPYAARHREHAQHMGALLGGRRETIDIAPVLKDKIRAATAYASQLPDPASDILAAGPEALWVLPPSVRMPPPHEAAPRWREIAKVRKKLAGLKRASLFTDEEDRGGEARAALAAKFGKLGAMRGTIATGTMRALPWASVRTRYLGDVALAARSL